MAAAVINGGNAAPAATKTQNNTNPYGGDDVWR
jgi:hypothetical protein